MNRHKIIAIGISTGGPNALQFLLSELPGDFSGSIVVVRVMYLWPVFLGPLGLNLSNQPSNKRLLMATAAFKNEP